MDIKTRKTTTAITATTTITAKFIKEYKDELRDSSNGSRNTDDQQKRGKTQMHKNEGKTETNARGKLKRSERRREEDEDDDGILNASERGRTDAGK